MAERDEKTGRFKRTELEFDPAVASNADRLRETLQRYGKIANARLSKLLQAEQKGNINVQALNKRRRMAERNPDKRLKFTTAKGELKNMDINKLRMEYSQLVDFLRQRGSTISGAKQIKGYQDEFLMSIGVNPNEYTNEEIAEFFDLYHKLIEAKSDNFRYGGPSDKNAIMAFARVWKEQNLPTVKSDVTYTRKRKGKIISWTTTVSDFAGSVDLTRLGQYINLETLREEAVSVHNLEMADKFEKRLTELDIFK